MRILVGCNLLTSVNSMAYPAHMQFWYNLGKKMPEHEFLFFSPRRMSIDRMRNEAAKLALQQQCDYLFFYDDDVILPDDCMEVLLSTIKHDYDVVGGVTCVRSFPFRPMIFRYVQQGDIYTMTCFEEYERHQDEHGIVECDAVGFSCCLIDVKQTIQQLNPPYFVTGPENTEDVYFCHKLNTEKHDGYNSKICVNTNITTGHILDSYYISPENKKQFIRLEKGLYQQFPDMINIKERGDRDAKYREQVMERLRRVSAAS